MRRVFFTLLVLLVAVTLAVGGWFGLNWLQQARADVMVSAANEHMANANRLMADAPVGSLGRDAFNSPEGIDQALAAADAAQASLAEARHEAELALEEVRAAGDLLLLADGYRAYLEIKEQSAGLRIEQLDNLDESVVRLRELYASGQLILTSVQEMDRLMGQFYAAQGLVTGSPERAKTSMEQIAATMLGLKQQLDAEHADTSFDLLDDMSVSVGASAELVGLYAQLADATAAGDQARAQQAALQVQQKQTSPQIGADHFDLWWRLRINPLRDEYGELQSRQEELDKEAAAAFAAAARR